MLNELFDLKKKEKYWFQEIILSGGGQTIILSFIANFSSFIFCLKRKINK